MVRGREFSTDNTEPMLAGTPRYFAPEQIAYAMQESSDEPAVDTATDVYALGAILYELVARRPLWPVSKPITDKEAMRDYVELRTSGVQPETPLPEHIEPSLAGLIRRCVRHDLRDRPRTAKDLRLLLRRYLSGETVALDLDATLEAPLLARQLAKVTLAGNERGQGIYDLVDPRAALGSKKAAATGDMADPKTTQLPPDTMDDSGAQQADMRRVEAAKQRVEIQRHEHAMGERRRACGRHRMLAALRRLAAVPQLELFEASRSRSRIISLSSIHWAAPGSVRRCAAILRPSSSAC